MVWSFSAEILRRTKMEKRWFGVVYICKIIIGGADDSNSCHQLLTHA